MLADIVVGFWTLLCFSGACLFMYWAFGTPSKAYAEHDGCDTESERRRCAVREMLRRCAHDDDLYHAVEWALSVERIPFVELEEILDELRPLADPHDAAAWAVRREQLSDRYRDTYGVRPHQSASVNETRLRLTDGSLMLSMPRGYGRTRCEGGAS